MPYFKTVEEYKEAVKAGPYAWPGGYPLFYVTQDGGALCWDCAHDEEAEIIAAITDDNDPQWRVCGYDINHEDASLHCDHCSERIESAYAEPEDKPEAPPIPAGWEEPPNIDAEPDLMPIIHALSEGGKWYSGVNGRRALAYKWGVDRKDVTRLISYCWNAETARTCRLRGDIPAAMVYEDICERIYKNLPDKLKW